MALDKKGSTPEGTSIDITLCRGVSFIRSGNVLSTQYKAGQGTQWERRKGVAAGARPNDVTERPTRQYAPMVTVERRDLVPAGGIEPTA
jgi:hypothetical protein